VPSLVAEHPQAQHGDAIGLKIGKVGIDARLVHIPGFNIGSGGIAGSIAVSEEVIGVGSGEIIGLAILTEVNAAAIGKTGRRSLGLSGLPDK